MVSEALVREIRKGVYELPKSFKKGMRVPGRLYMNRQLLEMLEDSVLNQVANVASLPGIVKYSIAMPDAHHGYGFPIGGVAAFDYEEGIVSPGGIGYDINCGVRLVRTDLSVDEIKPHLKELLRTIFSAVPSGVGSEGRLSLSKQELDRVCVEGVDWAIEHGYGWADDKERIEEGGHLEGANPEKVSSRAKERGRKQLGTLGSGNHFLEVGFVEKVYDPEVAEYFGLREGQVVIWIHTGSRGYGHQICDDYLKVLRNYIRQHNYPISDWELVYAFLKDKEAQDYLQAMKCAANFAWTNRQLITHWVRESFKKVLGKSPDALGMEIVYDIAHNIAKIETHEVDGKMRKLIVHRKGATRAFIGDMKDVPRIYKAVGHPVLIPGDMGRYSYVLVGQELAKETWFSAPHGAGRVMSRAEAKRRYSASRIIRQLEGQGILVMAESMGTVVEEVPYAYKDVSLVIESAELAGIAKKVARTRPLGIVKG